MRKTLIDKTENFEQNAKVRNFLFNREIPTLNKIVVAVNENENLSNFLKTSLHRILKHLNFEYTKKKSV